ncbi:MAG: GatB/YqeY domain-containing protein [Bacilli bacterium]|nr:GatB/YqeY domain-containing protein [Bacilli bacterium]
MIIDELQKANIEALKAHDQSARAVLSVVISRYKLAAIEAKANGKEIKDSDMVSLIGKVLKELEEEKAGYIKVGNKEQVDSIIAQENLISKYLPKLLSEDEIRKEIEKLSDKSIPSVMKHFKANFEGKVDMGLVNKIARSL